MYSDVKPDRHWSRLYTGLQLLRMFVGCTKILAMRIDDKRANILDIRTIMIRK